MQVLPPGSTGGPSRLFILRPVATTLLMAASFTRRDYRLSLPARRRFAGGRLPHYSGCYALPWRQPGCHDLRRHRAA